MGQQLASTENTQLKYSGSDFKFTSQANHMAKIKLIMEAYKTDSNQLQSIYRRRIRTKDGIQSTMGQIMGVPTYGYQI